MRREALFGPAGNSDSFSKVHKSSKAAPGWIADFGLDCYESQCCFFERGTAERLADLYLEMLEKVK